MRDTTDTTRCPVSVLIAARNEERNLPPCLEAVQGWADEVVVVDSHSTDATVSIAERHGATVVQFDYDGTWPKKRQWALDTHDWRNEWILILDADEMLTTEVKDEIRDAIRAAHVNGYWLRFSIVFLGRTLHHGDTTLWKLALLRRGHARYEQRLRTDDPSPLDMEVHEHVIADGEVRRLRNPIRHENVRSLADYIDKHNGYSTWEATLLAEGQGGHYKPSLFGGQAQRRRWLKSTLVRLPGAPLLRFLQCYVLRGGFLDGRAGLIYSTFKAVQMFHVKAKIYEARKRASGRGATPASPETDATNRSEYE